MKLVIIEGPGKRETLKKYLGEGYEVFATKGHVRDLPVSEFGVDLKSITPTYKIMDDKVEVVNELKKKAKKAKYNTRRNDNEKRYKNEISRGSFQGIDPQL